MKATLMLTYDHLTQIRPGEFAAEASDLGLAPGVWPHVIYTKIGNGLPLARVARLPGGAGFLYAQDCGSIRVHVLND